MDNKKDLSIKDIAKLANVSTATVSRVINHSGGYSKETEKKIKDIIDTYGYVSNNAARSMRLSKSQSIGLIIPDIQNEFFSTLAQTIEEYFYQKNYSVFICNSSGHIKKELDYFKRLESQSVDGIIDITCQKIFSENTLRKKIPIVFVDRLPMSNIDYPTVRSDDYNGICASTQLLIDNGCQEILYLNSHVNTYDAKRLTAYKDILSKNNILIDSQKILYGNPEDSAIVQGEVAVMNYLHTNGPIDGIVCSNDGLAVGALYAAKRFGLKIPDDIQIVGFDNSLQSQIIHPAITTVSRNPTLIANAAATLLMNIMNDIPIENKHLMIDTHLVIRQSTIYK